MKPTGATTPVQVRLDGTGAGEATFTARGPGTVWHLRLNVAPVAGQPAVVSRPYAVLYHQGHELDSTYSGHRSTSETQLPMEPGDTIRCVWSGGDAGAVATMYVRGMWA